MVNLKNTMNVSREMSDEIQKIKYERHAKSADEILRYLVAMYKQGKRL